MKRKILTFIVCVALIFTYSSSMASSEESKRSIGENIGEESYAIILTLEDAIKCALRNSSDIMIQELNITKSRLSNKQNMQGVRAYEDFDNLPDAVKKSIIDDNPLLETPELERRLIELGYVERSGKLGINIAEWNKEIIENKIRYDVEKSYFDLFQIEKELEIAKESLELARKQYDQSKKMFDLGTISKQQLLTSELATSQAQSGYDAALMGYELQKMSFCNILGLKVDQEIILKDKIEYGDKVDVDIQKSIKDAFDNNGTLKSANEGYELSKLTLRAIEARYPENTYKYKEQEIIVEQSAQNLEEVKGSIEIGVRSAYYNLITAEKQIKTYEKAVEIAQNSYDLTVLGYELGQNTSNDVTKARIELMDAKKNLSKQIHAYNLALIDFRYSTGLGKNTISSGI